MAQKSIDGSGGVSANSAMSASMLIGAGSQLIGAWQQAEADRLLGEYQSQMGELNAKLSASAAEDALKRGNIEANQVEYRARILAGRQRAVAAATGINPDSGSVADIKAQTFSLAAIDSLTAKNNAIREAFGHKIQGLNSQSMGDFARETSKNKARNTLVTGGLQALSSAGQGYYYSKGGKDSK